ncbi:hypothetical protein HHE014_03430 [Helicobacter heilmannii]|nr:hypothetical protein HHE014_03430 [Helicobacter heilmannii]
MPFAPGPNPLTKTCFSCYILQDMMQILHTSEVLCHNRE